MNRGTNHDTPAVSGPGSASLAIAQPSRDRINNEPAVVKECMNLKCQHPESSLQKRLDPMRLEGSESMTHPHENPGAELRELLAPGLRAFHKTAGMARVIRSSVRRVLTRMAQVLRLASEWLADRQHLRQVLVSFLPFLILAQPNLALAQSLTAPTPYERARQAALAASLPGSSDSWLTKATRMIPDPMPLLASVASTTKAAFLLVFPFEEAGTQPVRKPGTS